jgi:GAF domain-containing protein
VSHRYDEAIAAAMAVLTADVANHTPIETTLRQVTDSAVRFIDGVDCADITLVKGGEFQSLAATSPVATKIDQAQYETGQGPCLDAVDRDVIVRSNDLRNDARWPHFASAAVALGIRSVMSFRLYTQGSDSGALNLFGSEPGPFAVDPEALGAMLATHAAVSLIAIERHSQFTSALASRDLIGQAKGIIMERFGVDAVRAFELLARLSQDSNTPLRVIAAQLANGQRSKEIKP